MSKIFIHVGLPKTATTFFQKQIFPNLSRTTCIARPYTQQNSAFKKLQYADSSLYNAQTVKKKIEEIKGDRTIFSDECFVGNRYLHFINRALIAERFSQIFPEAEIIIFLRGQEDILVSIYNQAIKAGRTTLPLEDFIWRAQEKKHNLDREKNVWNSDMTYFNSSNHRISLEFYLYYKLIQMYYNLFKKVHIFLYEEFKEKPQSVVERILAILDDRLVGVDGDMFSKNVNSRLSPKKLKLKRYENKLKLAGLANNKYILKASALALSALERKDKERESDRDYIRQLVGNFYLEDNRKLINNYPHIPLTKYPKSYQF